MIQYENNPFIYKYKLIWQTALWYKLTVHFQRLETYIKPLEVVLVHFDIDSS